MLLKVFRCEYKDGKNNWSDTTSHKVVHSTCKHKPASINGQNRSDGLPIVKLQYFYNYINTI